MKVQRKNNRVKVWDTGSVNLYDVSSTTIRKKWGKKKNPSEVRPEKGEQN